MKKNLFIVSAVFLSLFYFNLLEAKPLQKNINFNSFSQAKESKSYIKFTIESTKAVLFSSDVDGYVKNYSYKATLDKKKMVLRNMRIEFDVNSMDTDNKDRNEKMQNYCLEQKKYPKIVVFLKGPLHLNQEKFQKYTGTAKIRGKEKTFEIELKAILKDKEFSIEGESTWSFEKMDIPDPSIVVASVSDEIAIKIFIHDKII